MARPDPRGEQGHLAGLSRDSILWRKASRVVVAHGPAVLIRALPPVFGVAAALALPDARRRVGANLLRIRGRVGRARPLFFDGEIRQRAAAAQQDIALVDLARPDAARVEVGPQLLGRVLDGFGNFIAPPATARPVQTDFSGGATAEHPPGFYGPPESLLAVNTLALG